MSDIDLSCLSCAHFRAAIGEPDFCAAAKIKPVGFPALGPDCRMFDYEPGSDEVECQA